MLDRQARSLAIESGTRLQSEVDPSLVSPKSLLKSRGTLPPSPFQDKEDVATRNQSGENPGCES